MLIEVKGEDGSTGFICADDVRGVLPAQERGKEGSIPVLGKCVVQFKSLGPAGLPLAESPANLAAKVNAAREKIARIAGAGVSSIVAG